MFPMNHSFFWCTAFIAAAFIAASLMLPAAPVGIPEIVVLWGGINYAHLRMFAQRVKANPA